MTGDALSLRDAAAELGVTYDWLQRHWRTLPGFPPPYLGGGHGQRPRWCRQAIREFRLGRRWPQGAAAPVAPSAAHPPANDPTPLRRTDRVAALIAAAGG